MKSVFATARVASGWRRALGIAVALLAGFVSQAALATTSVVGVFNSDAPSPSATLTPGQIITVTLTANAPGAGVSMLALPTVVGGAGQFEIVPGGTCVANQTYFDGQSCTIRVRFLGNQSGSYNATLQGSCVVTAVSPLVGMGFAISCGINAPPGVLAAFLGNGILAAVNTLGPGGLGALAFMLLALGSFFTLRRGRG